MTQEPKPGKRIVSKGEYVKGMGSKFTAILVSIAFIAAVIYSIVCFAPAFSRAISCSLHTILVVPLIFATCLVIGGACMACYFAFVCMVTIKQTDVGLPLTRANTADLPASDSLVRASQEPVQAQEGVLLRAAAQTQDGHEEQLLRASVGGQE